MVSAIPAFATSMALGEMVAGSNPVMRSASAASTLVASVVFSPSMFVFPLSGQATALARPA